MCLCVCTPGLIVNEIGMEPLMSSILELFIAPLSKLLFPKEIVTQSLDHHHSFVVEYASHGGDLALVC